MDNITIAAILSCPFVAYHIAFNLDKIFNKIDAMYNKMF